MRRRGRLGLLPFCSACADARSPRSVELSPYVLLRRADGSCTTEAEGEGFFVRCRWLRSSTRQRSSSGTCGHGQPATLQSVQFRTFHCSPECFAEGWRAGMERLLSGGTSQRPVLGLKQRPALTRPPPAGRDLPRESDAAEDRSFKQSFSFSNGAETWSEVRALPRLCLACSRARLTSAQLSTTRAYTPGPDDVGYALRFECAPAESASGADVGPSSTLALGARVVAAPQALPRRLVPLVPDSRDRSGRFTVLTYNVLSDIYASVRRAPFAQRRGEGVGLRVLTRRRWRLAGRPVQLLPQLGVVVELQAAELAARAVGV